MLLFVYTSSMLRRHEFTKNNYVSTSLKNSDRQFFQSVGVFFLSLTLFFTNSCVSFHSSSPSSSRSRNPSSTGSSEDTIYVSPERTMKPQPEDQAESFESESADEQQTNVFDWPVDKARFSRGYRTTGKRPHLGIDLAAPRGTDILSAQDGTVIYAGRDFRGYGRMVLIEGMNGWATLYAHFDKILVKTGQSVQRGDLLGKMGRSGRATGVHLHFEVRKNVGPVDPLLYLPGGKSLVAGR